MQRPEVQARSPRCQGQGDRATGPSPAANSAPPPRGPASVAVHRRSGAPKDRAHAVLAAGGPFADGVTTQLPYSYVLGPQDTDQESRAGSCVDSVSASLASCPGPGWSTAQRAVSQVFHEEVPLPPWLCTGAAGLSGLRSPRGQRGGAGPGHRAADPQSSLTCR